MSPLAWSVELPASTRAPMGAPKPRARVLAGEEVLTVPLAVGKRALKEHEAGKRFGSRAELVFHLGELQEAAAFDRAAGLLERRDYAFQEMRRKLELDGYWSQPIGVVLERLERAHMLDDARYASVFARSKVALGWGSQRVERELARKGIDISALEGWPEEFLGASEYERALQVASRRSFTGRDPYAKAVRYLVTRGYAPSIAHRVAKELTRDAWDGDDPFEGNAE